MPTLRRTSILLDIKNIFFKNNIPTNLLDFGMSFLHFANAYFFNLRVGL